MDSNLVLLDADFCHIILKNPNNVTYFKSIFEILDINPAIHTYVFNNELFNNIYIKTLVTDGFISIIEYKNFLHNDFDRQAYKITFKNFYEYMNYKKLKSFNIFKDHRANHNLGEIHSLIAARYLNIPLFMSNDNRAKELAMSKINNNNFKIDVQNVKEVIDKCNSINPNILNSSITRSITK